MNQERVPGWTWTLLVVASIVIGVATWWFSQPEKKLAKQPPEARVEIPVYGTYDFSSAIVPGEVKVPFRSDSWSEVTLPAAVVFRTDPSSDIEIVFVDGSRYIDGPGRQVWFGLKRGVFKIRGLTEAGVLKITLEKKT